MAADIELAQMTDHAIDTVRVHFSGMRLDELTTVERVFPTTARPDLEAAIDRVLNETASNIACHGVSKSSSYDALSFVELIQNRRQPPIIGPLEFMDIDVGRDLPARCFQNALYLFDLNNDKAAMLISQQSHHMTGQSGVRVEVIASPGAGGHSGAQKVLAHLVAALSDTSVYRGQTLSFETARRWSGGLGALRVHKIDPVSINDIILPETTLKTLQRTVFGFVETRSQLKQLGFSTKRGLLLYGPPGTGKTHFIRYMLSQLVDHTALLVTAEQVGAIDQIMVVARALQPSIVVIEDADLIARSREDMGDPCEEILLNKLLNEMDGLTEDCEIMFVLTTNRPDQIEEAIRNRPGRIDQTIEVPKPDAECRLRLLNLYLNGLVMREDLKTLCVQRTQGVTASFIKELARRMAQFAILRGDVSELIEQDMRLAFEDLFGAGALNATSLGAEELVGP